MNIRSVKPNEAQLISELAIRSKAHWGYDDNFMHTCREELSHSTHDLTDKQRHYALAESNGEVVGFYTLEEIHSPKVGLLALFIDPGSMGHGIGRVLFADAYKTAKTLGAQTIEIQSDPFAETFYQKMGAVTVGQLESGSIKDRFLPLMKVEIS